MGKYKFIKEIDEDNKYDNARIEFEVETETWTELLEYFEEFLKGCGYHINGKLDVVGEE